GAPSVISEVSIAFSSVVGFGEKVCTGSGVENRCGFLGAYEAFKPFGTVWRLVCETAFDY
ncbi:hypothetical protein, partial [Thiolapillus sp.]